MEAPITPHTSSAAGDSLQHLTEGKTTTPPALAKQNTPARNAIHLWVGALLLRPLLTVTHPHTAFLPPHPLEILA